MTLSLTPPLRIALALLAAWLLAACGDKTTSGRCAGNCLLPPDPVCRDGSVVAFAPGGTCEAGTCVHDEQVAPCEFGCEEGECLPDPGPCFGVTCASPPRDTCDDSQTAVVWEPLGACDDATGECEYTSSPLGCEDGTVCFEGDCVVPDCSMVTCDDAPAPVCREQVAVTFAQLGVCDPETLECAYNEFTDDCAARGERCVEGSCVRDDRCDDVTCENVLGPFCEGEVAVSPDETGVCDAGVCSYGDTRRDCAAEGFVCRSGACADLCAGVACSEPPLAGCDGDVAVTWSDVGACELGECTYTQERIDCAASGQLCSSGVCSDDPLCLGVSCTLPPDDTCDGDVAVIHERVGDCAGGDCTYDAARRDCAALGQSCVDGDCVDLCDGVVCTAPPEDFCVESVAVFYGLGTCELGACDYDEFQQDCALIGRSCIDGACRAECRPELCTTPPPGECSDNLAIRYEVPGSCEGSLCVYDTVEEDCAARGATCIAGGCVDECFDEGACDRPPEPFCTGDVLTTYAEYGTCDEASESCQYASATTDCAADGLACDAGECVPLCAVTICAPVPAPTCDGDVLVQSLFPAGCEDGVCVWDELRLDCTSRGEVCNGGACVNACIGVICNDSPDPYCDSSIIARPRDPGVCVLGACTYPEDRSDCAEFGLDCDDSGADPVCFDPCAAGIVCDDVPDDFCEGTTQVIYTGASACVFGECIYSAFRDDCGARGLGCLDAECIDLCAGISCTTPADAVCVNDVAVGEGASGFCLTGACQYPDRSIDCSATGRWCVEGDCVDACDGVSCPTRTDAFCDGQVAVQYQATPALCDAGVCEYDAVRTNCLELGQQCVAGACAPLGDVCDLVDCSQRAPFCDGDELVTDSGSGSCDALLGVCEYAGVEERVECEAPLGCVRGACVRTPQGGDLVITEIFYDANGSDLGREWFEIRNVSAVALPLDGLTWRNPRGQSFTLNTTALLAPGAYQVFKSSNSAAGGAPGLVYAFESFSLANTADTLVLLRNGAVLDVVEFAEGTWPAATGSSIALAPSTETTGANDVPANWCVSEPVYDVPRGERGTPGFSRSSCR